MKYGDERSIGWGPAEEGSWIRTAPMRDGGSRRAPVPRPRPWWNVSLVTPGCRTRKKTVMHPSESEEQLRSDSRVTASSLVSSN